MKRSTPLRRLMSLVLCLVLLMQTIVVSSAADAFNPKTETPTPTSADSFEFKKGTITGYNGKDKNVVIPASIDDVEVIKIDQAAFAYNDDIESVVIPSTVKYVGDYAFDTCSSLTDLYFYGEYPAGFADTLYMYEEEYTYFVIHCKDEYKADYEDELTYYDVAADITDGLADPAYASHNWMYTDNGNGTHNAYCKDTDCDAVKTNVPHEYVDGKCVCDATVDPSDPKFFTYTVADGAASITGYTGPGGEVTLPSSYTKDGATYPVTSVADRAFNGSSGGAVAEAVSKITKLTVPASVTSVGNYAFNYVGRYSDRRWSLQEIVFLGENVTFGTAALGSNPNLKSVTLPSGQKELSGSLFASDTALEELVLPASVTSVGEKAFSDCTALKKVTFLGETAPTMAKSSGYYSNQYPFVGCVGLTLYVPDADAYKIAWADMLAADITKAGDITLANEDGSVAYIPDFKVYVNGTTASSYNPQYMEYHVVSMDSSTKSGKVELKYVGWNGKDKTLDIPESASTTVLGNTWSFTVIGIGANAIEDYKSTYSSSSYAFTAVNFPDTLEYIDKWGCDGLEKVTEMDLSNTKLTEIRSEAFRGCKSLVTVKLPATLTKMGITKTVEAGDPDSTTTTITSDENIFACCDALQNIYVDAKNPSYKDVDGILYSKDGKKLVRYPNARPATEFTIPEGVEVIASQAFMQSYTGDSVLQKVNFPSTLKEIESLAFRQSNLTEVTLPAGVKFGNCAFDICKKLEKVTISEGVTELSDYMFWSDEAITEIKLPSTLKKIGDNCFGHCTKLATVDLNKVESIGAYAFYYTPVTEITIPSTAQTIGRGAFAGCQKLTKATFEEGAKEIAPFMFSSNYELVDLTLADSIESVGEYAFSYCVSLKEVTMPKSLKSMGDAVFYKCWKNLTKVIFPDEVQITALPASTFENCQNLTYVYLGKNIFKTQPVSLYDTSLDLVVECAVKENRFSRNAFDVYGWDLKDTDLFATCEDTGEKDAFGYPIYKVQLTDAGVDSGCCGGSASSDGYYYIGAGANPTFKFGSYEPVVFTVTGPNAKGDIITVSFTKTELEELAVTAPIGYQYWKGGTEMVVASDKYVPIQALLEKAGIVFGCCDSITVAADDGFGTTMTYTNGLTQKYYIDKDGNKTEVPAALLLRWNTGSGTLEEVVATAIDTGNLRFGYGIGESDYGSMRGSRLVSKVATLTVNVGADASASHTPGETVIENKVAATATENGSHDEAVYCTTCGAELSRKTVTDPATGSATTGSEVKTGDTGVALYVGLCLLTVLGGAWTVSKKRSVR